MLDTMYAASEDRKQLTKFWVSFHFKTAFPHIAFSASREARKKEAAKKNAVWGCQVEFLKDQWQIDEETSVLLPFQDKLNLDCMIFLKCSQALIISQDG